MHPLFAHRKRLITGSVVALAVVALVVAGFASARLVLASGSADAKPNLIKLSTDPFTNAGTQHQTQVEPSTFAFGNTIVAAFQSGRGYTAGSSDIGWATSNDKGKIWKNGFLPDITVEENGPYARASDSVVAYDAAHKVWLIALLGIPFSGGFDVLVSRSTDGGLTWSNPIAVDKSGPTDSFDKEWISCDTTAISPFYGHCYVEFDNAAQNQTILMSTSTDGGLTWSAPNSPPNQTFAALGGLPLAQPGGKVIVPIFGTDNTTGQGGIYAYTSIDGGASWTTPVLISTQVAHFQTASLRGGLLPAAQIDGSGKVYVVWTDCRFISGCTADDIVMSTSTDGTTWSAVQRIPIAAVDAGQDNFLPAIAVDPTSSGSSARLGVAYYYFPNTVCFTFNCNMTVGFISSTNGGASWSAAQQVSGPVQLPWLADTNAGFMAGDYIAASFVGDKVFPAFPLAIPPSGGHLNEATFTVGLPVTGGTVTAAGSKPVVSAATRNSQTTQKWPHSAN